MSNTEIPFLTESQKLRYNEIHRQNLMRMYNVEKTSQKE